MTKYILILWLAAHALDYASTRIGLASVPGAVELNPIYLLTGSWLAMWGFKLFVVGMVPAVAFRYYDRPSARRIVLVGTAVALVPVVTNLAQMLWLV